MSTMKKCKVVMLSTNEKANCLKGYKDKSLLFAKSDMYKEIHAEIGYVDYFHLYILSDDEIKEGDWYLYRETEIKQYEGKDDWPFPYKKIIATTNSSLIIGVPQFIKGCLPQLSQSFIEKYIEEYNKGNVITDVLVEYYEDDTFDMGCEDCGDLDDDYIPLRLKVNPKDNTITIKKVKDSWNREEVINLLQDCWSDSAFNLVKQKNKEEFITFSKWIEENL